MQVTNIFTETVKHLELGTRRLIHQGGTYSGKTVNILPALAKCASEEDDGGVTTVTSMSLPHLKGGALRDFETFVYPQFKGAIKQYHKTDHLFTFKSGSIIEFKVFENEMTARGPKRKRLFVNEANKMDYLIWFALDGRSDQSIIDYNPSVRFWAHTELIGQPGNIQFISDHRGNPFLTPSKHAEIEGICQFKKDENGNIVWYVNPSSGLKEPVILRGDYELWKVYARGLTGNVTGVIFPDWEIIDNNDFPKDEDFIWGIDFGYTIDPTAIMKLCLIGDTLYIDEIAYESGIPGNSIINLLKSSKFDMEESVLYAEHDPDMVRDLRNLGIANVFPARKGQGSVNAGIQLLKQYKVKYTARSRNLNRERSMYVWETEKDTGRLTNVPVDNNNHTFDAIRYAAYTKYLRA